MRTVGLGLGWQDFEVGQRFRTVGRTIGEIDIVNFVNCTGMTESLFNDLEYIREHSAMGGRVAPAALVYATAEGLLIQATLQRTGMAFLNMELDVENPCRAGDTVHVRVEVTEVRPASKGDRGLVRTRNEVFNQADVRLLTYTPLRLIRARAA